MKNRSASESRGYPRRLAQALPAYLGGKRRLAPLIFALLAKEVPPQRWPELKFLDPMCGGGSVALLAKAHGFQVVASDLAERGAIGARALIANSSIRLKREDVLALFAEPPSIYKARAATWVPSVFDERQAAWLDRALAVAEARAEPTRSLLKLLIIKVALRLQPMSMLRGTDARAALTGDYDKVSPRRLGHYLKAQFLLEPAAVWEVAQEINLGIIGGTGRALQGDAKELIRVVEPDGLYLDPPYAGTSRYEKEYEPLDHILGDEAVTKQRPATLHDLLGAAAAVPVVVVSYGGPTLELEELSARIGDCRTVLSATAVHYPHLRSIAKENKNASNQEFIVIAGR